MPRQVFLAASTAVLLLACAPRSPAPVGAGSAPLFRHVQVTGGRFVLGEPIPAADRAVLLAPLDDSSAQVRPGVYGSAERVVLRLTPTHVPWRIEFAYDSAHYWPTFAEYTRLLGPPRRLTGAGSDTVALWQDARTQFWLVHRRGMGGARYATAAMVDRERAP